MLHHNARESECVCVCVVWFLHVRSHSLQLDAIVAPHSAVFTEPVAQPQGSNGIVKEGGGEVGVCGRL